jgi:hypothetical protein
MKVNISDEDLNKLGEILGKDSEVYQKIFIKKKYKKHKKHNKINIKVRKLRTLAKIAKDNKVIDVPQIPDWLFRESLIVEPEKSIDLITIDTLNMLNGHDRKRVLDSWHDWKKRQKEIDKRYARAEERRIYKMRAMKKDPEGWAARTLKYKEREKAKNRALHATTKWKKTHRKTRGALPMTKEEKRARQRELVVLRRKDPAWIAKYRERRRQIYYNKHKDEPGWLEQRKARDIRHKELQLEYDAKIARKVGRKGIKRVRKYVPRVKGVRMGVEERKLKDRIRAHKRYIIEKDKPEYIAKKRRQYEARLGNQEWVENRRIKNQAKYAKLRDDPEWIMKQVEYYLLNRETIRERSKERYLKNRKKILAQKRAEREAQQ